MDESKTKSTSKSISQSNEESESIVLSLPKRPARSKNYQNVLEHTETLVTNCYKLSIQDQVSTRYNYDIDIVDADNNKIAQDNRELWRKIINSKEKEIREAIGMFVNKGKALFALQGSVDPITFITQIGGVEYSIILKQVKEILLSDLQALEGRANPVTQLLNIVLKRIMMDLKFREIGRNSRYFNMALKNLNPVQDQRTDYQMNVWRGYLTSSQIWQNNVYVLVDPCSKALRKETALEVLSQCKDKVEKREKLVQTSVMTMYGNERNYIVDDVDFDVCPTDTFEKEGKDISYVEYYKTMYQINIKDLHQPLIVSHSKAIKKLYLIPELVRMTGIPDNLRTNPFFMKAYAKYTKLDPQQRWNENEKLMKDIGKAGIKYGLKVQETNKIDGLVLKKPTIKLGGNNNIITPKKDVFNFTQNVVAPAVFTNWIIMYNERDYDDMNAFVDEIIEQAKQFGIKIDEPLTIEMKNNTPQKWEDAIDKKLTNMKNLPQMVMTLCNQKETKIYDKMKEILNIDYGIPHQNVYIRSLKQHLGSVCANIVLQVNAKMGLPLWYVEKPKGMVDKTMIIGIDVYHHRYNESFVGFVASIDPRFTKFFTHVNMQKKQRQEVITNIGGMVELALKAFWTETKNKFMPECIVLYRDGVGDGQFDAVYECEVFQVLETLKKVYGFKNMPEFTFILVNKRIHQRFFFKDQKINNPKSGTICNTGIVSKFFDFYLAAQNVFQGTCTPTHYTVLYNTTSMKEEVFWQLTYFQTFNYYNWKGPVRVPAPCQYAHKLAYFVGQTIKTEVHKCLVNTPYYL